MPWTPSESLLPAPGTRRLVLAVVLWSACAPQTKMTWPQAAAAPPANQASTEKKPPRGAIAAPTQATPKVSNDEPPALAWPIQARALTSRYGLRADPLEAEQTRFHRGIDLSAHYGALVRAAAAGRIAEGDWHGGYGRHVRVEHNGGMVTSYSHLSLILVSPGMWVEQGDPIGLVGESGRATGPHLHFEVLTEGRPIDPQILLGEWANDEPRFTSAR